MDGMPNIVSLAISNDFLNLIAEIDEFKGRWQALGRIAPDRLSSLKRIATIESIGSSTRIEGSKLSDSQIKQLLSNIEIGSFVTRDEQEVAGYADVMETVFANYENIDLTENYILQLHRDLLKYSHKDERHRGDYKKLSNNVEAFDPDGKSLGIIFETASPFDTPERMKALIAWARSMFDRQELHPLLVIAVFIVVFLEIHPFQDGNGRLSRILTTLLLLRAGYSYLPYGSIESIIEQSKEDYYIALRQTQGTLKSEKPDWAPWVEYFLKALRLHKDRLGRKIEREKIILGDLPELSLAIIELVREHGRITVADAARLTGTSRNTIKDHIAALVKKEFLERHGAGRGTWYALR